MYRNPTVEDDDVPEELLTVVQKEAEVFRAHVKSLFTPSGIWQFMKLIGPERMWNEHEDKTEFRQRMAFYAIVAGILSACGPRAFFMFVAYYVLPLVTSANIIGFLEETLEHYPLMLQPSSIFRTRNRLFEAPLENFFFGLFNDKYHLVHHLYGRIPGWSQPEAHSVLMLDPTYNKWQEATASSLYELLTRDARSQLFLHMDVSKAILDQGRTNPTGM